MREALDIRGRTGALPFAGGTDLMVRRRGYTGTLPDVPPPVLFLDNIGELRALVVEDSNLRIGAGVTMDGLLAHPAVPELLRRALAELAAPAIRNRATLGGNICNASPAADSLPPLYVHRAAVVLMSRTGERCLPIDEFILGPGKTVLRPDELLTEIVVPALPADVDHDSGDHRPKETAGVRLYYRKVGTRKANALSKLSAAGFVRVDRLAADSTKSDPTAVIGEFRFALGAVAPVVVRLDDVGRILNGRPVEELSEPETPWGVAEIVSRLIHPIGDQRSSAFYRREVAMNCCSEFLKQILEDPCWT
jgi:xanthine dehydrogenase FAD-binding subunit